MTLNARLRKIERGMMRVCGTGCAKCAIARIGVEATDADWAACDGKPLDLFELLTQIGSNHDAQPSKDG